MVLEVHRYPDELRPQNVSASVLFARFEVLLSKRASPKLGFKRLGHFLSASSFEV